MAREKILIVDDEENILELISYNLKKEGYQTECFTTGEEAVKKARADGGALILLDLMLPGLDGLEVLKILKNDNRTEAIPVIIVSAKGEESDIVAGLELGADDYITKPFSVKILVARVRSVLRRKKGAAPVSEGVVRVHDLVIDPVRHEVKVKNKPVELTATEFRILQHLAQKPGRVFTRNQIINAIRGENYIVTDRTVDVQITGLRKKLKAAGEYLETIRGVGYRFKD